MRLEEALGLKKGTVLVATRTWVGPEGCTEGREYVMQEDAKPLWLGEFPDFTSDKQLRPGDKPCNVELPIIGDQGKLAYPVRFSFEVKPQ